MTEQGVVVIEGVSGFKNGGWMGRGRMGRGHAEEKTKEESGVLYCPSSKIK